MKARGGAQRQLHNGCLRSDRRGKVLTHAGREVRKTVGIDRSTHDRVTVLVLREPINADGFPRGTQPLTKRVKTPPPHTYDPKS